MQMSMENRLNEISSIAGPTLGEGIYSLPDAARILHLPRTRINGWAKGYSRILSGTGLRKITSSVLNGGNWGMGTQYNINFMALIELYVFATLRERGFSSQKIKKARSLLSRQFDIVFPFANHRLLTDHKTIWASLNEKSLLSLDKKSQTAFKEIIEPFCRKIEYDDITGHAERFWPLGRSRSVVVDPHHRFGQPTIAGTNISTETIAQYVSGGDSPRQVSAMFDISESSVKDAIEFELSRAA